MRFKSVVIAGAALAFVTPAAASARTCLESYYICLNNSYYLNGWAEYLANLECGAAYYGCLRRLVL